MPNLFFDHNNIYLNNKPFYPIISSSLSCISSNVVTISIDCSNTSTLNFKDQIEMAEIAKSQNKYIIWDIFLDLENPNFLIHDELLLKSNLHSLNYFTSKLYTLFKDETIGVILYSGSIPEYRINDQLFANWKEGLSIEESSFDISYLKKLYSCNLLSYYLRLIAPEIPDEILMIVKFDVSNIKSPSKLMKLISKEKFEYFLLALKGANIKISAINWEYGMSTLGQIDNIKNSDTKNPSNVAVCFASNQKMTSTEMDHFDEIFSELSSLKIDFKVVEEAFAIEQLDGLDYIIVRQKSLSTQGKRMLQGFQAALGICVYHDSLIGIASEISFEEFKDICGKNM